MSFATKCLMVVDAGVVSEVAESGGSRHTPVPLPKKQSEIPTHRVF